MIHSKLGSSASTQDLETGYSTPEYELYEDNDEERIAHTKERNYEPTPITYDTYIGAEVFLPKGNDMGFGAVKARLKDFGGQPIGNADENPIVDTKVDNVSDGENVELGANIIEECMYAQCDIEGN